MLSEQEKKQIKQKIKANRHEVYVISLDEMEAIIKSSPKGKKPQVKVAWKKLKGSLEFGANYAATGTDVVLLKKLVRDLGGYATKAYVKTYGGKPHIILKGHPGLRKILTGTRYGINNPKVIAMGLGRAGVVNAVKQGGILSVVLLTAYRVAEYFLSDQPMLSRLIGSLATDVVKVGITMGASIGAAALLSTAAITFAIGPLVAVILVGLFTSFILTGLDNKYGITEKVIVGLDEMANSADYYVEMTKQKAKKQVDEAIDSVFDYVIGSARRVIVNTAIHSVNRLLSNAVKVY